MSGMHSSSATQIPKQQPSFSGPTAKTAAELEQAEQDKLAHSKPDEPLAERGGPLLLEISNEVLRDFSVVVP
jgi:hypothetical protein